MKAEKSNRKAGIKVNFPVNSRLTFPPEEYENMRFPKEKTKEFYMSLVAGPVPFEATADAFFTSKDQGGASVLPCRHDYTKRAYSSYEIMNKG
jgi:hypothetical protein